MAITRKEQDNNFEQWRDWHVLTMAKPCMAALELYARGMHGIDIEAVQEFADKVNRNDDVETLYPTAPVTAIPFRYFTYIEEFELPIYLEDFKRHIKEFIELNRTKIHARKILVDFHRDSDNVPDFHLTTTERAFREYLTENEVDEVVVLR
jgi:hypothetical protein